MTWSAIQSKSTQAAIILLIFSLLSGMNVAVAQKCQPLLLPGKKTLFQRVITHPGANLYAAPDQSALLVKAGVKPFTIFYVYKRISANDTDWLQVGPSSSCTLSGWIDARKVSEWHQSLTLVFTERAGRQPVLFFKHLASLESLAESRTPGKQAMQLAAQFKSIKSQSASAPANFPVFAMEPPEKAVSQERFYLIPIFQTVELFEGVKFLQVASIDPGSWQLPGDMQLRTAIAFVIDTTISMKPYIDRTRQAVRNIYDAIEKAGLSDKVAFGLVAFRSSIEKTPELEYTSKVISDLRDGRQRLAFERALGGTEEAKISSHSYDEDAFAGLKTALDELNWAPFKSRLILFITDAGAIRNDDPYSTTGMNEAEIADLAAAKGVKIFALHLKTPLGKKLHDFSHAAAQYRVLTGQSDPTLGDLYVPIDASNTSVSTHTFGRIVEGIAEKMVELVRSTAAGERLRLPSRLSAGASNIVADAQRKAAILGYAMQLDFLGQRDKVQAPHVVTSWVSDMDLVHPDIPAFKVTVLLTKNQLSDLHQRLKVILDQAQRTKRTGAKDFFQGILSAAAQISRDPTQFSRKPNENLGQLGLLAEFLDDLPYRSNIMRLTEKDWYRMSVGEQQAVVDDLKSKIRAYQQYHDDVDNWISFGAADPGDSVYRVPLSMMP